MIAIRNAVIELGPGISAESAERIVRRALELVAAQAQEAEGSVARRVLPQIDLLGGSGCEEMAQTVAAALAQGLRNGSETTNA